MIPLSDINHRHDDRFPYVTVTIIGLCVAIGLYELMLGAEGMQRFIVQYGFIPARLEHEAAFPRELAVIPGWMTWFTSMFLHGGVMHLAGNMLYLWIFGDNIEARIGHGRYLTFYLVCGVAAAFLQYILAPDSVIPMVGASGAISGVLGGYLLLYPTARVKALLWFGFFIQVVHIPAKVMLLLWFVFQLFGGVGSLASMGETGGTAFWAHIGGFLAGMALVKLFVVEEAREVHVLNIQDRQDPEINFTSPWKTARKEEKPSKQRGPWDRR